MELEKAHDKKWSAKGLLYVKNYPSVVKFTSGYIYRFGKFKFLSEDARSLYVDVNTEFLKHISDYPKSTSNDLSIKYMADSSNLNKMELGSIKVDKIGPLYMSMLYKKLFDKVGYGGDVLTRMHDIIPDINANDPILQKILPKISGDVLGKSIKKQIDNSGARDVINKIIPKKALDGNNLFKNLIN